MIQSYPQGNHWLIKVYRVLKSWATYLGAKLVVPRAARPKPLPVWTPRHHREIKVGSEIGNICFF